MNINREHPEYIARKAMWRQYQDLYAGGEQLRANASDYLVRRQKEPGEVYEERLSRVFYENYIGSIIDWYAATLMRREPVMLFEGGDDGGAKLLQPAGGGLRSEGHEPERVLPAAASCRCWWADRATSWWIFRGRRAGAGRGPRKTRRDDRALTWWITRRKRSSTGATTRRAGWTGW